MTAIDTVTRAVVATIPVDGHPSGLAVDPTTHDLWVVGAHVSVIDPATYTVSTTIQVGDDPEFIAIDPQQRTAYVTHFNGHSVSLIDIASRTRRTGARLRGRHRHDRAHRVSHRAVVPYRDDDRHANPRSHRRSLLGHHLVQQVRFGHPGSRRGSPNPPSLCDKRRHRPDRSDRSSVNVAARRYSRSPVNFSSASPGRR
ncbi:YncE family protein [Nocardia fluminea]